MADSFIKRLFGGTHLPKNPPATAAQPNNKLEQEMNIGRQLFGQLAAAHNREFYYLGNRVWQWNETWQDQQGRTVSYSTRYQVAPTAITKVQNGQTYQLRPGEELTNLVKALQLYYQLVSRQVYGRTQ